MAAAASEGTYWKDRLVGRLVSPWHYCTSLFGFIFVQLRRRQDEPSLLARPRSRP